MMLRSSSAVALLLAACSLVQPAPKSDNTGQAQSDTAAAAAEPNLVGSWRISEIDGRAPVATAYGDPATLSFDENRHGGNAGCNNFGGYGLQHEGRWFGSGSVANQMACGAPRDQQDEVVMTLLASGPSLEWEGADRVQLTTAKHRAVLARLPQAERTGAPSPPPALLGTKWRIRAVDGNYLQIRNSSEAPQLRIEGDRYRLETACQTIEGLWRQEAAGQARFGPGKPIATRACQKSEQANSQAILASIVGLKRYVGGPNSELLLAGQGHWIEGEGTRDGLADSSMLVGRWQREPLLSNTGADGQRPAEVIFLERSFFLWDGCNGTEGLAILFERQLITRGSGLSTLARCNPQRIDKELEAVIGSQPRVGQLASGGLVLSSPAGKIRLRKIGAVNPSSDKVSRTLGHPMRFNLLGHGGGTLEITGPTRFRLTVPCGVIEGRWRREQRSEDGAYRFGPHREPEACSTQQSDGRLAHIFRGNIEVAIGPNRDIALFAGRFGSVAATLKR